MSIEAPNVPAEIEHRGPDPAFPEVRETPSLAALVPEGPSPARPNASDEPVLHMDEIQGNIVAGFNKDF